MPITTKELATSTTIPACACISGNNGAFRRVRIQGTTHAHAGLAVLDVAGTRVALFDSERTCKALAS